jgi:hypothetical protein
MVEPRVADILRGPMVEPRVAQYLRAWVDIPHAAGKICKYIIIKSHQDFPQDWPFSLTTLIVVSFRSLSFKSFRRGIG